MTVRRWRWVCLAVALALGWSCGNLVLLGEDAGGGAADAGADCDGGD